MRRIFREIIDPKSRWYVILQEITLFILGGLAYNLVELIWRQRTDPSMFVVGGLCFIIVGSLNEKYPWEMPLCSQMFISMIAVTFIEFVSGVFLNIMLKMNVWDYSNMPYNVCGQICLIFSVAWFFLSFVAIYLDDVFRHLVFGEEKPHYTLFVTKPPEGYK